MTPRQAYHIINGKARAARDHILREFDIVDVTPIKKLNLPAHYRQGLLFISKERAQGAQGGENNFPLDSFVATNREECFREGCYAIRVATGELGKVVGVKSKDGKASTRCVWVPVMGGGRVLEDGGVGPGGAEFFLHELIKVGDGLGLSEVVCVVRSWE